MSLQYHWEDRFLNRQDPWILKPQRDHLLNLTEDLEAALSCLNSDGKRVTAALAQRILHPFCYLICGTQLLAQGSAAVAERLLAGAVENPDGAGRKQLCTAAFYKTVDSRDNQLCIVQECQMGQLGGNCSQTDLKLVWKPMTNGEWRLFVIASAADEASASADCLGFRRLLNI